jgi:nucleoid-associated protein YgaU
MSPAFRIFFLILLLFISVWIYRFRAVEIDRWLRPSPLPAQEGEEPLVSRVNRIPALSEPLTRLRLTGGRSEPGRREALAQAPPELSEEERLLPADLPTFEAETEPEVGPEGELEGQPMEEVAEVEAAVPKKPAEKSGGDAGRTRPEAAAGGELDEILYTVQEGDSLWKIAQNLLGEGSRYREIRDLNPKILSDYNLDHLLAGTVLKIRIPPPQKRSMEKGRTAQASSGRDRYIR